MNGISRRSFIQGAGIGALGVAGASFMGGCAPAKEAPASSNGADGTVEGESSWKTAPAAIADAEINDTYDCDVLIIGLGHAGSCALRAAAEAGAVCYGMEVQEQDYWSYTGFQMGHINSNFLKSRGVPEVDPQELFNDWQLRSNNRSNPALIMKYARNCGDTFDWLFDDLAEDDFAEFSVRCLQDGGPYMREFNGMKSWVGTAVAGEGQLDAALHRCVEAAEKSGGKVLFGTKALYLLTDDNGAVVGAIGESAEGHVRVNAAKGVIICTGGFGTNQDMCKDLLHEINDAMTDDEKVKNALDRDGSGIQMGYWAGGRLDPCMGTMDGAYWYSCDSPTDPLGATAALWINAEGKRYCNEGFGSTELMAMPGARQPKGMTVTVFDDKVEDLLKAQAFGHMGFDATGGFDALRETLAKAAAGKEKGSAEEGGAKQAEAGQNKAMGASATVYAANDLPTLAAYLGYEGQAAERFVESIERYNELCEKGVDEDFGKDATLMKPVSTPPFYAYGGQNEVGVIMVTVAGLLIDENGSVLGQDYRPIKGLYAAGNASGGRFGWQYFTSIAGQSLTIAHTLGRLTGAYVAQL